MNIPYKNKEQVSIPPKGYAFPFIDKQDGQLKAKLSDGLIIKYTNIQNTDNIIISDYYSSFEVMPNKTIISSGTTDDITGLIYNIDIPSCTTHKMTLRSAQEPEDCDVVIDWGDGTVEAIKDGNYVGHTEGKSYELSHDYSTNMTGNIQRFIVKIYGKDYYTFRHNSYASNNLISRIFDAELPIADHVTNFASMCLGAMRLLKVKLLHSTSPYVNVFNWSSCFQQCTNLLSVTGFEDVIISNDVIISSIFRFCSNLIETDFRLVSCAPEYSGVFQGCEKLEKDINDLLPKEGFGLDKVNVHVTFTNMKKLYGTIDSTMLWNNPNKEFLTRTTATFAGCSAEIIKQVPKSWGGSNKAIDTQLTLKKLIRDNNVSATDFTAWQVYAHDYEIPSDSDEIGRVVWNDASLLVTDKLIANNTQSFYIRSQKAIIDTDVIIDWGDDYVQKLADMVPVETSGSAGDYTYKIKHTYKNGHYTIRIYGKDYYNIYRTNTTNNLLCKCFTKELPIASHITSLSQFAACCLNLLKVHFGQYNPVFQRVTNWNNLFWQDKNLLSAKGFRFYARYRTVQGILGVCTAIKQTDFKIGNFSAQTQSLAYVANCPNLSVDINSLFNTNLHFQGTVDATNAFNYCYALYGTVPAHLLWGNPNVTWKNTSKAFEGCHVSIRNQVPISWGGLNASIDTQLTAKKVMHQHNVDTTDYSAFQVYAHKMNIPAGDTTTLGAYVTRNIPASMYHKFTLRTNVMDNTTCDVVVDWGDGYFSCISKGNFVSSSVDEGDKETNFVVQHTYAKEGRYTVKIYGKDYFNFNHGGGDQNNNLLCRIFAQDLPIASHIQNLATTAYRSGRLLEVKVPSYTNFYHITNWSNCFQNCTNLLSAKGFKRMSRNIVGCPSVFANCPAMTDTDFRIPYYAQSGFAALYVGCTSLNIDIKNLQPVCDFIKGQQLSVARLFQRCTLLKGTVNASKWWNNHNITWKNTSSAFIGCSDEIRAQVPVSWGGTASDDIINKTLEEKIAILEQKLNNQ